MSRPADAALAALDPRFRIEELEREVAKLRKLLANQQRMIALFELGLDIYIHHEA